MSSARPTRRDYDDYGYHGRDEPDEPEHWTDYCGLIGGVSLLVLILSLLAWAYFEDQKDLAGYKLSHDYDSSPHPPDEL
eukprot:CAMPEP_0179244716 /NCGR_PEP_ID=MMETSP0797-20121207/18200_1 /TAXON_ID=47934 /ORGANISM="Dinophysis acuminata, Strain DAEP01" /LENGTH=78 /DNA_ID=CAMNT_0020952239 /DNA_START=60 /DNA_END=296 /DNA_ORIENTATION=+